MNGFYVECPCCKGFYETPNNQDVIGRNWVGRVLTALGHTAADGPVYLPDLATRIERMASEAAPALKGPIKYAVPRPEVVEAPARLPRQR